MLLVREITHLYFVWMHGLISTIRYIVYKNHVNVKEHNIRTEAYIAYKIDNQMIWYYILFINIFYTL